MNNGVALGSIIITRDPSGTEQAAEKTMDEFELQYLVGLYDVWLTSGRLTISPAMEDYMQVNNIDPTEYRSYFDWSILVYVVSNIKSSYETQKPSLGVSTGLLSVTQPNPIDDPEDSMRMPFEIVSLGHMRDALGWEFHIHSDPAARQFLSHLHHLGFYSRVDGQFNLFHGPDDAEVACNFAIPLGLDLSTDVEMLVAAVEGCLSDLDLSVNEGGFLLLSRRLWPSGMASDYALRRLARNVVSWVLAEVRTALSSGS